MRYGILIFVFLLNGCFLSPTDVTVDREVNFCFADDFSEALVVISRYDTSNPDAEFFNDPNAHHYRVLLKRTSTNNEGRDAFFEWDETFIDPQTSQTVEISRGGNIAYAPVYWLKSKQRLIGQNFDVTGAFILDLDSGKRHYLDSIVAFSSASGTKGFSFLSNGFSADTVAPAPNGETVVVLFHAAYEGDTVYDLRFKNLLAFYDSSDARLLASAMVPIANTKHRIRIWGAPSPNGLKSYNLLWGSDGSGVFLPVNTNEVYFVSLVDGEISFTLTNMLPEFPYPPLAGPFLSDGTTFKTLVSGNNSYMELTQSFRWFDISKTNFVSLDKAYYLL